MFVHCLVFLVNKVEEVSVAELRGDVGRKTQVLGPRREGKLGRAADYRQDLQGLGLFFGLLDYRHLLGFLRTNVATAMLDLLMHVPDILAEEGLVTVLAVVLDSLPLCEETSRPEKYL